MSDLIEKRCLPCEGGIPALTPSYAQALLKQTPHWTLNTDNTRITRQFDFKDFHQTMAFVNAVAWIAHREDHHPDLEVGYNRCVVHYSTHAVKGLTENDFICAAKINRLMLG